MPAKTHGMCRTPEYVTWTNMISRCEYENRQDFKHYGGRGIKVCERWRSSFENFFADMGYRPFPKATLERVRVNEGYEPGNCVWTTQKRQTRNKRNNHLITVNGETAPIAVFAERAGINQRIVLRRLLRGWPPEEAIRPITKGRWATKKGSIMKPAVKNSTP